MTGDHDTTDDAPPSQNHYRTAWSLAPSRERREAIRDWLEEEMQRLDARLRELEGDDGTIPDENSQAWHMAKGRFDQTRLFYGLAVQGLLADDVDHGGGAE